MSSTPVPTRLLPIAAAVVLVAGIVPLSSLAASAASPLVLRDADGAAVFSGDAAAYPSFATAYFADGCPAGTRDGARLTVSAGGSTVVVSATVPVDGGAAVSVPMGSSFRAVVPAGATAATLSLECLALSSGVPSSITSAASLPVTLTASGWSVPGQPAPTPTTAPTTAAPSPSTSASVGPDPAAAVTPRPSVSTVAVPVAAGGADLAVTGAQVAGVAGLGALLAVVAGFVLRSRARRRAVARD
ncbi:hypothetical protein [Microbacterium sp. SORGH_AS_0421]|uniref:hypothetical protein n=1 Tax=Microbacterium sp. SORGH_AS_0421 TaxID=3041768 RepID=UPI00278FDA43|nr:hypothetical protein [Microbacterium sp. SORGH_AS_0421]MDQ1178406.1 hypothetical protein [Microbacterium sp. SORGH_AS_0421]